MEIALEVVLGILFLGLINLIIYDKYVQRESSLLINYPAIGRMRYLFELLREPLRQYFGEENFFSSRDKVDWVYKAAKDVNLFLSFSVSQPYETSRFVMKHSSAVLNDDEVSNDFSVTFGETCPKPFVTKSVIARSAMSDGALSPEATRAFSNAAMIERFPINTGEGGLTSNYFFKHELTKEREKYVEIKEGTPFTKWEYRFIKKLFNGMVALRWYKNRVLKGLPQDTFTIDFKTLRFYRINWDAPLENFPKEVPEDVADIILQIGSGLYGVRDKEHNFDPLRYQKVMRFCKMTEIKIAQGAKQTGGKIMGSKVTDDIAYYRGVEAGKDLISPNRFPHAKTYEELFDFIAKLRELSSKPVGFKIVVSDIKEIEKMSEILKKRDEAGLSLPDFISIDGGDGGSATAPLELMEAVGLNVAYALYIVDKCLRQQGIREKLKLIASGKILTPDDVAIHLCIGADMTAIARGFMLSGGCIRARVCSGAGSHKCPVGLATQDKKKRLSYLVVKKTQHIANYHKNLVKSLKTIMAVMGISHINQMSRDKISYKNNLGEYFFNVDEYFKKKLHY